LPLGWRMFECWTLCPQPRVGCVRVGGVRVVAGRVGADGWVCGQVAMQCVVDVLFFGGGRFVRLPAGVVVHVS
jgi:hypothetical protein